VLDLSKIEAGKLELSPESVALALLIDQVIGTARQLAEQNNNRLVVEMPEGLGTLPSTRCGCARFCSISSATPASSPSGVM
jgi:signal transduction histidine kinase